MFAGLAVAQFRQSPIWLKVTEPNPSAKAKILTFGADTAATYGTDSTLGETEQPPVFNGILEGRWIDPRFDDFLGDAFGQGRLVDYRKYTNATQLDTFELYFAADSGYLVTMYWPKASELAKACTGLVMVDEVTFGLMINVDMFLKDSLQIVKATKGISKVFIYRTGEILFMGVKQESHVVPGSFSLRQNYPNPFNPTTTITFDIAKSAVTDIAIYDMLGRKVTTLMSGQLNPGTFSTQWNGRDEHNHAVASGVYYARMTAHAMGGNGNEEFSAVRKLMLMK